MPELPEDFEKDDSEYERDYSKVDLVDLIEQPAWKTILIDMCLSMLW